MPTLAPTDPVLVSGLVKSLKDAGPNSYLMINASQVTLSPLDVGYSDDLGAPAAREPRQAGKDLKKVLPNDDVTMYALQEAARGEGPGGRSGADRAHVDLDALVGGRRPGGPWRSSCCCRRARSCGSRRGTACGRALIAEQFLVLAAAAGGVPAALVQRFLTMK